MDETQHTAVWTAGELVLERHRYPAGPVAVTPRHAHDDVQLCLSLDLVGSYWHRGGWHVVPPRGLSVVGAGEVHASRDLDDRHEPSHFLMLYAAPDQLAAVAGGTVPAFPLLITDPEVFRRFVALHGTLARGTASALERDGAALGAFGRLVVRHAAGLPRTAPDRVPTAVARAREHLLDDVAADVSLADLGRVANVSPFHLARAFSREVGLPPHAFQVQARVERARRLLLGGGPVSTVAQDVGFYDESHLHRHFTRIVGVPPGRYRDATGTARAYKSSGAPAS